MLMEWISLLHSWPAGSAWCGPSCSSPCTWSASPFAPAGTRRTTLPMYCKMLYTSSVMQESHLVITQITLIECMTAHHARSASVPQFSLLSPLRHDQLPLHIISQVSSGQDSQNCIFHFLDILTVPWSPHYLLPTLPLSTSCHGWYYRSSL